MQVFALVGKSGTGKSYHCIDLAHEKNIKGVIDDGLLIADGRILAGRSAKHETNKIASVKRAIFECPQQAADVAAAIKEHSIDSVLVLGTSDRMVRLIASRIGLPDIQEIVYIEDIATPEEIQIAFDMRNKQGKHIIPAPVPEVKKQFSGYFLKSLTIPGKRGRISTEDTIIRPTYSYMGSFKISPRAIADICRFEISKFPQIAKIHKIQSVSDNDGFIEISVEISLIYPSSIPEISDTLQKTLRDAVEYSTSISAKEINIFIKSLTVSD